jgi:hypothetical protein
MGSAGLRAGDWRISGMVGHTFCHIVDRTLVLLLFIGGAGFHPTKRCAKPPRIDEHDVWGRSGECLPCCFRIGSPDDSDLKSHTMLLIFHFAGLLMKNPTPLCEKDRSRDCRQKGKKHCQFNSFFHHG